MSKNEKNFADMLNENIKNNESDGVEKSFISKDGISFIDETSRDKWDESLKEDGQTFEQIVNDSNIDEEKILSDIDKIGYEDTTEQTEKKVIEEIPEEEVILDDINGQEEIIGDIKEQEEIIDGEVEENKDLLEIPRNIEYAEDDEIPLEEGTDINEYEDIYSNSDQKEKGVRIAYLNKKKLSTLAKRGIAIIATIGVITGSVFVLKSCGKKNKNTTTVQPTTTVSSTEPTTTVPTTNDELDVEVEVNTKPIPTIKGEIDSKNVVIDKNGTAWESKEDASKAPKNGNKEEKVESGYLAPDGNVYESKEEYQKLISAQNATKKTEKKLYYATDGTAFESKKDRDAWNEALKQQNSTTKKLYYATDGTAFENEADRDKYNESLKAKNSTTKKYYIADDGTYFETKEDMDAWNNYLKSQKTDAVQKNAYSSRQEEIYLLKQYKNLIITSSLVYNNQEEEKTFSL